MSDLVGNPEDRFSRVAAHFTLQDNECLIEPVPYRGVNCSDAVGKGVNYYDVIRLLKNSTTGRLWDETALSPYFNYKVRLNFIPFAVC